MWSKTYSKTVGDLTAFQIFSAWSDIDRWPEWLDDVESTEMLGPFTPGSFFKFKPKGGPNLKLELTETTPNQSFTDMTRFPFARMYDVHELVETPEGVEIRSTVKILGLASFLWRKIVAEGIAANAAHQTELLIARVRTLNSNV